MDISLQTLIRENSGFNSVILKQSIRLYSWYTKQKHTLLPSVINVDILENKDMEIHKDNERSQFPKILSCKVWDATFKCKDVKDATFKCKDVKEWKTYCHFLN